MTKNGYILITLSVYNPETDEDSLFVEIRYSEKTFEPGEIVWDMSGKFDTETHRYYPDIKSAVANCGLSADDYDKINTDALDDADKNIIAELASK